MSKECYKNSVREVGCWSFNVAVGYKEAIDVVRSYLEYAVKLLNGVPAQVVEAEKQMKLAQASMDEANRWFNRANNQMFRINTLIEEVKLLRQGQTVSYAEGQDPTEIDWAKE